MMNGKGQRSVGLSYHNLVFEGEIALVKVTYRLKIGATKGAEIYPNKLRMKSTKIMTYPTKTLPSGVVLYVVPIEDFEEVQNAKVS